MRAIGRFIVLTFATTWLVWVLLIRLAIGHDSGTIPPPLALGGPLFLLGVFAPGLIAIALTMREGGRRAAADLLRRVIQWRVDFRLYAFALLLMPLVKLAVAVVHHALTGAWPQFGETRPILLLLATLSSTVFQAGEELGWRGYLLPRMAERTGLAIASLVVGVIWAAWHLPLFFAPGADTHGQSFPLYTLQVTALSIVLAWLYWRSGGSLLITMFMHAAFNNLKDIVPSGGVAGGHVFGFDSTLVFRLTILALWTVAGILLVRMKAAAAPDDATASASVA